ncbi:MAG: LapA family protein [Gammaproteobacteria bacterium]|jgi:lipopolysaccharide assembly protein A
MLRKIATILFVATLLVAIIVFTWLNTERVTLDLAFTTVETQIAVAFTITFALGWLVGLISTGFYALRSAAERRRLRKSLEAAEEEVSKLRSLPLQDAAE